MANDGGHRLEQEVNCFSGLGSLKVGAKVGAKVKSKVGAMRQWGDTI